MRRLVTGSLVVLAALCTVTTVGVARVVASVGDTASLVPLTPCRLLDTRSSSTPSGNGSGSVTVVTRDRCGVPSDAIAVAVTIAVVDSSTGPGFLTAWSGEGPEPTVSNLNWSRAHETRANSAVVNLSAAGNFVVTLSERNQNQWSHIIVDVTAAFAPTAVSRAGRFSPLTPVRVVDTRTTGGRAAADTNTFVPLPATVAGDAVALAVNITLVDSASAGYASVMPHGEPPPPSSSLNLDSPGQTRSAATIVAVSNGGFDVYTSTAAHVVVDVTGWFTGNSAPMSTDGLLVTTGGVRVLDTRATGVVHQSGTVIVPTPTWAGSVSAALTNVTMIDNADVGWLVAFPAGRESPSTSTVNGDTSPGVVANTTVVGVGTQGIAIHASVRTHVIVDVLAWFTGTPDPGDGTFHRYVNEPVSPPTTPDCSAEPAGRVALVDRVTQLAWLCDNGRPFGGYMPFTAGPIEDAPKGVYRVYFKRHPWHGGGYELQRFTAFTRGNEGGRVAFHRFVEMPESAVGTEAYRNMSSGCLRMRTKDAIAVWNFLRIGDRVVVLNNA